MRTLLVRAEDSLGIHVFPRDRILSAVSDDGLIWRREHGVRIDVRGAHGSEMVYWPRVFRFPGLLRMYFMGSLRTTRGWTERILSAVSADGLEWVVENGVRIDPGGEFDRKFASAPYVVQGPEGFRMYYAGSGEGKKWVILSAVSSDGLGWTKEKGVRLVPDQNLADSAAAPCLVPLDNGWRMYFTSARGYRTWIGSALSADGLNWRIETGHRLGLDLHAPRPCVAHPSVVALADSSYRMYFVGNDGCAVGSKIYSAVSADGLRWNVEGLRLDYSGPLEGAEVSYVHVVQARPSLWRMYYTGFWGRHLLRPWTARQWGKQARRIRRELEKQGLD